MQGVIEKHEVRLEELDKEIEQTERYIDLLVKYGTHYDRDNVMQFWFLKVMPGEIRTANIMGNKMSKKHEDLFLMRLEEEKSSFKQELRSIEDKFKWMSEMSDYTIWRGVDDKAHEFNGQIDNAYKKKENFDARDKLFKLDFTNWNDLIELNEKYEPYKELRKISSDFESLKGSSKDGILMKVKFPLISTSL
jgi:hypothetical protein